MNDEPLFDIVLQMVSFLELSDEGAVDEDAAVQMLERIALSLQSLDPETKARFVEHTGRYAEGLGAGIERELIERLPKELGLLGT